MEEISVLTKTGRAPIAAGGPKKGDAGRFSISSTHFTKAGNMSAHIAEAPDLKPAKRSNHLPSFCYTDTFLRIPVRRDAKFAP